MDVVSILGYISIWIILFPLFIGFIYFNQFDFDSKLIFVIVLIGSIPQVLRPFIENTHALNILYNLYTPLEFFIYWTLFNKKIKNTTRKMFFKITLALFCIVSVFFIYEFDFATTFINEWVIINNIFQLIWISIYLLEFYFSDDTFINSSQPFFWFLIGITGYASCTAIFYSLWNFIKNNSNHQFILLNLIHHIFNILIYLFFAIGFLKNLKKRNCE